MKEIEKNWGKEIWIVNNELYCLKRLFINSGFQSSIHWHKNKDETFIMESGSILLETFGEAPKVLKKDDIIRLKPNTLHRFIGISGSSFLEVSTHHDDKDSYRVVKSSKINRNKYETY